MRPLVDRWLVLLLELRDFAPQSIILVFEENILTDCAGGVAFGQQGVDQVLQRNATPGGSSMGSERCNSAHADLVQGCNEA